MIAKKTVFVVGAGASYELGFPLSETLLTEIAEALDFKIDYNDVSRGDRTIWINLLEYARLSGENPVRLQHAAWRVRDAAHLGISVDNIIHQQKDDPLVALCAKLGIARRILIAESECALQVHEDPRKMTWPEVRGTWLGGFARLLVQNKQREALHDIFDNVIVISFNYDRTIRRFLPFVLTSQFAIEEQEAQELSRKLRIYHPYGSLGHLEWENPKAAIRFGDCRHSSLLAVANNIRTFTEQTQDHANLDAMRTALSDAEHVVFLGFGYIPQNMELITQHVDGSAMTIMGTSVGLSEPDTDLVTHQLNVLFKLKHRPHKVAKLSPLKCADFLRENLRTLTY